MAITTIPISTFRNSIGICTATSWEGKPDNDVNYVINSLNYAGIGYIREEVVPEPGNAPAYSRLNAMANAGIKCNFIVSTYWKDRMAEAVLLLRDFALSHPNAISSIEGLNEVDLWQLGSYGGLSGSAAILKWQQDLYNLVRAQPALNGAKIFSFTYADNDLRSGNLVGKADVSAAHFYYWYDNPQPIKLAADVAVVANDRGLPVVITENGRATGTYNDGYVQALDETTAAKICLNTLFEACRLGVIRTFLFELSDLEPNPGQHWGYYCGMNKWDKTPKVQAGVLNNLSSILSDTGSPTPKSLPVTVSGLPSTGRYILLEKTDGTLYLVLWNLVDIWNHVTVSYSPQPSVTANIDLGASYKGLTLYDPMVGKTATNTYADGSTVSVQVPDHPVILAFTAASVVPPVDTGPANITIGTGTQKLVFRINQDFYLADCQYQIRVDGVQIGGTLSVKAKKSLNQNDTVTVLGGWSRGTHNVRITFLNDAWGGTADTDRNMYINGATINGATISLPFPRNLTSNGDYSFNFKRR